MTASSPELQAQAKITSPAPVTPVRPFPRQRVRIGLSSTLVGFLAFLVGARPAMFGLDRSSVVGFVQLAVMLVGLAFICIGGFLSLAALWHKQPATIPAEIGLRLVATGYVICVFCGMADVFGFGSHPLPGVPYFGPLQAAGVEFGEIIIAIGFVLLIPYRLANRP